MSTKRELYTVFKITKVIVKNVSLNSIVQVVLLSVFLLSSSIFTLHTQCLPVWLKLVVLMILE